MTAEECAVALSGTTASLDQARCPPEAGGVPNGHGFYAWWIKRAAIPGLAGLPHPSEDGLELLYVGIGPVRASSGEDLQSRVMKFHLGGNTGSSTLRLSLAGLLMEQLRLTPLKRAKKVVLSREDNQRLSEWQDEHLKLTWCQRPKPWEIEHELIRLMQPPLNLEGNAAHPFHATNSASRARFRAAAVTGS